MVDLEKRVKGSHRKLSEDEINEIICSYEEYDGNAIRASRELGYSITPIIKYWRNAGLEIKNRGRIKGSKIGMDNDKYNLINKLISEGHYQSEIARILGVSRQAVNSYINYYNLQRPQNELKRKKEERYNLVRELTESGATLEEVSELLGINLSSLSNYFFRHPKLPRPKRKSELERELKRKRKIEIIKKGLLEGLSQNAIAKRGGISPRIVYKYVNEDDKLRKLYDANYEREIKW